MYKSFENFILRTPLLPLNTVTSAIDIDKFLEDELILEAIYLASPVLYLEIKKYLKGSFLKEKEKKRIRNSVTRYLSRMSSRCTPFGLFAGLSVGSFGKTTKIMLKNDVIRRCRLDMGFLNNLAQHLQTNPLIKSRIRFYPNDSLYRVGTKYRYLESRIQNGQKKFTISSVDRTIYLDNVLKKVESGLTINEIKLLLTDDTITENEALSYIHELIDNHILLSELEPNITGIDFFTRIIAVLKSLDIALPQRDILIDIAEELQLINCSSSVEFYRYKKISNKLKELGISFDEKFLFQMDMKRETLVNVLGTDVLNEIESAINFLLKITPDVANDTLGEFLGLFRARYEEQEIPLLTALDPEIGLSYPPNAAHKDSSPLLENFFLPDTNKPDKQIKMSVMQRVLITKLLELDLRKQQEIVLSDDDFQYNSSSDPDKLPSTIYAMFEIVKLNGEDILLKLKSTGGQSAANLLTRFAHIDAKIENLIREITKKEHELSSDLILAEIVHLPHSRTGNILTRPHIRDYELTCVTPTQIGNVKQIRCSDLMLSVKKGKFILRSKRLNMEVLPCLTNAHNYRTPSSLSLYRFLCDLQGQGRKNSLFFSWGYLETEIAFKPRIRYSNIILSPATWEVQVIELTDLFSVPNIDLISDLKKWRLQKHMPQYVFLPDGDNELLINMDNLASVFAMFDIIKGRKKIHLRETLLDLQNQPVKDVYGNGFRNEFVTVFHKS